LFLHWLSHKRHCIPSGDSSKKLHASHSNYKWMALDMQTKSTTPLRHCNYVSLNRLKEFGKTKRTVITGKKLSWKAYRGPRRWDLQPTDQTFIRSGLENVTRPSLPSRKYRWRLWNSLYRCRSRRNPNNKTVPSPSILEWELYLGKCFEWNSRLTSNFNPKPYNVHTLQ